MDECGLDIRALAGKLVRTHGKDAPLVARQWCRCAQKAGETARFAAWVKIERLVKKILSINELNDKLERDCQIVRRSLARRDGGPATPSDADLTPPPTLPRDQAAE